jgi:hypothetical protein
MPTIGTTTKPSSGWHSYLGSSETNQEAELLTMPERGTILELGAWLGGWNGTARCTLNVWAADGSRELLGRTAQFTVANEGAGGPAGSNVALYTATLTTPVGLSNGEAFLVGFTRHPDDGHQVSIGASGGGPHYHGRVGGGVYQPDADFGPGAYSEELRRVGVYVADYEPKPGGYIRRSSAWAEPEVYVRRSSAWAEPEVYVRRSGAWIEPE